MTVGEKIQYFRKKSGLSQEELGSKLLVSRQTVSLWEMDKTMPTVDNLLRLKEIFGVSVDEILDESKAFEEDSPVSAPDKTPLESYQFEYTKEELQEYNKKVGESYLKRVLLAVLILAVFLVHTLFVEYSDLLAGILLGIFSLNIFANAQTYRKVKKWAPTNMQQVLEKRYLYEVHDTHLSLKIFQGEELKRYEQIRYENIQSVKQVGSFLVLGYENFSYLIRKADLIEHSRLRSLRPAPKTANKKVYKDTKGILNVLSMVLFIGSILTIFCGMATSVLLSEHLYGSDEFFPETMWGFLLFLPIPISSIILSIYLKCKGYNYLKNLVIGIVMAALLCIYGSFSFIFSDMYAHDDGPILRVEEKTGIDIPKHKRINTMNRFDKSPNERELTQSTSDIYFEMEESEAFEKAIAKDRRWLSSVSNSLLGLATDQKDPESADYFLLFNEQTGEFNTVPEKEGVYQFINLFYDCTDDILYVVEYELEYKK